MYLNFGFLKAISVNIVRQKYDEDHELEGHILYPNTEYLLAQAKNGNNESPHFFVISHSLSQEKALIPVWRTDEPFSRMP